MINRRNLMGVGAAVASSLSSLMTSKAEAKSYDVPEALMPRGRVGRLVRLPKTDLESRQDFLRSFRTWANTDLSKAAAQRADAILAAKGIAKDAELPRAQAVAMLQDDPLIATSTRAWLSTQTLSWDGLKEEFEGNADVYLSEMEKVDKIGGKLELNPDMKLPDYTRHEIHIQPGGYVGNAFAGHMYQYGTNGFYMGRNDQDEMHRGVASKMPVPADGKVLRILDVGTGIGQLAMALKERFPNAEVWGIDAGGPMVRYGHMRSVELGLDVNFAQRLGEDTKFPDNYFDIVTSYIMFHEVSPEGAAAQVKEAYRITRPGGIYYPLDFKLTGAPKRTAYGMYRGWWDHRWNNEVWSFKFREEGLPDMIRKVGFALNEQAPELLRGFGVLNATKTA